MASARVAVAALLCLAGVALLVSSFSSEPTAEVELEGETARTQMLSGNLLDKMDDENETARASLARLRKIQKILMRKIDKKTSVIIDTVSNRKRGKRGPPGHRGPPGQPGEPGKMGRLGKVGPRGKQGPTGPRGMMGQPGVQGNQGPTGPEGSRGFKGEAGPQGFQGRRGPRGDEGLEGERGPVGPPGPRGNPGPLGMAGAPGPEGGVGVPGPEGRAGSEPHNGNHEQDGLMLVDCQGECCGLRVQYQGQYGSICDDTFTDQAAYLACRQLGFSGGRRRAGFGGGENAIWLSGVQCGPNDKRIQDCTHRPWGTVPGCLHQNDVGVCCTH